jgi:hypothetical protein
VREIHKIISKMVRWWFESLGGIFFVCIISGFFITLLELRIFNIPDKYADGIWLTNTILAFIVFLISKKSSRDKYKETIDKYEETMENLMGGYPTEEEIVKYENELKQIDEEYKGVEAFKKIREFIVRKRMEDALKRIDLN